jgi:site-specific DNA-methyltransferase (adenine-specific)
MKGPAGRSTAWGSWRSAANPTFRDVHEYVLVFSKQRYGRCREETTLKPDISSAEFLDATTSVWRIIPESAKRIGHPAPFPIELPRRLIRLLSFPGDSVLDPFLGSGTTGVAAVQTGRRFIGYDTSPEYVALAGRRIQSAIDATHQTVLFPQESKAKQKRKNK